MLDEGQAPPRDHWAVLVVTTLSAYLAAPPRVVRRLPVTTTVAPPAPVLIPCSCGCTEAHVVMTRTTVDGVAVYLWSDGATSLDGPRLRLDQARWLMGEMELYEVAELPALVAVARKRPAPFGRDWLEDVASDWHFRARFGDRLSLPLGQRLTCAEKAQDQPRPWVKLNGGPAMCLDSALAELVQFYTLEPSVVYG